MERTSAAYFQGDKFRSVGTNFSDSFDKVHVFVLLQGMGLDVPCLIADCELYEIYFTAGGVPNY